MYQSLEGVTADAALPITSVDESEVMETLPSIHITMAAILEPNLFIKNLQCRSTSIPEVHGKRLNCSDKDTAAIPENELVKQSKVLKGKIG